VRKQTIPGLVSLVVASYNHAEYLVQRMESLIGQTYQNTEILVIEDCSPDNSLEVLRKYESHPKVRLIVREKNGGWVNVSNQGIEESSGEFILFANCDDDCEPRMVEKLVNAMQMHPTAGIAFCRSFLVDECDQVIGDDFVIRERAFREKCKTDTLLSGEQTGRFLLYSCIIPNLSAALIRKECFEAAGPLSGEYRVCSDWDLFFRIVARYDVAYVAEPLNKFRQHQTTIRSLTKGRVTYEEFFRLLLGQVKLLNLTFIERCRFRSRVMYLWVMHMFSQPWIGLRNFPYHLKRVLQLDPMALVFFIPGLMMGIAKAGEKFWERLNRRKLFLSRI
jgi:glycosyltransferase involved in cell wall biosynthesis